MRESSTTDAPSQGMAGRSAWQACTVAQGCGPSHGKFAESTDGRAGGSLGGGEEVAHAQQALLTVQVGDGAVHGGVEGRDHCGEGGNGRAARLTAGPLGSTQAQDEPKPGCDVQQ